MEKMKLDRELFDEFLKILEQNKIQLTIKPDEMFKWATEEMGPIGYLMFGITYECQLECPHCCMGHYKKEKHRELTTEEIKDVLDQAAKPFMIDFFGGEPTLRPDLMELIKYATTKSLYVFCDTNGIKVTKDYAKQLKDNGLEILNVSVDSPIQEKHDKLRGKGSFEKAVGAIKNAHEVGLKSLLSTYITKENLANGEFEAIIQLAKDIGAVGVRYLLPTPAGRWLWNVDVKLTREEEKKVSKITGKHYPFLHRDFWFQNQRSSQCRGMSNRWYMYISPYGDVQPCCFMPLKFGNVREEPLKKIVGRMWNHEIFDHPCIKKECPMLSDDFRKKYINQVKGTKLPFNMCQPPIIKIE
ncbi:MAG: radical SAM protein [Candidatus Helarchaeota archaeon]|nr:radical SAM protein [Candidatus Helarchaeota archaeon]